MRIQNKKFTLHQRLVNNEPLVVFGHRKKRDAPVIYHRRDGPLFMTGPPSGTGPPGGVGPPKIKGNGLESILRKNKINGIILALKLFKVSKEKKEINFNKRKTKMKNFKLKRLLSLAFIGGLSALNATSVIAAAGDLISNTATLNYDVATVAQAPITSLAAEFWEDRKVNFTVAEANTATTTVTPNATVQVQTFTVTNDGNDTQDFLLSALNRTTGTTDPHSVATDIFDIVTYSVYVDSAATTVLPTTDTYLAGTDTAIFIDNLAAGTSRTVYIVSTIPATVTNNQVSVMSLVAQVAIGAGTGIAADAIMRDDNSHVSPVGTYSNGAQTTAALAAATNANGVLSTETVFADAAGDVNSAGVAGAASNGQHSDSDSYTVSAAALTVAKTVTTLWDPINGNTSPKAIPGAYVQYSIAVVNAGPASASLTTLADTLVTTLLDPNLILATATTPVPTANTDAASGTDGNGIRVVVTGSTRAVTSIYCTGDTAVDGDADGCSYPGDAPVINSAVGVNLGTLLVIDVPNGYTAGEIKATETATITFNAIVQ